MTKRKKKPPHPQTENHKKRKNHTPHPDHHDRTDNTPRFQPNTEPAHIPAHPFGHDTAHPHDNLDTSTTSPSTGETPHTGQVSTGTERSIRTHKSHAAPTQPAKPSPSLMLTLQISHTFQQVGILLLAEVLAAACLQVLQLPDGVFLAKFSQYDVSVITLHSGFRLPFDGFIETRPFSRSVSGVEMSECGFRCPHGRA